MIKRVLSGAVALTMAASLFALSANAAILGDVDDSGKVDIEDAVIVLNHINGVSSLDNAGMNAADVDSSGSVDIEDVVGIINQINGTAVLVKKQITLSDLEASLREQGLLTESKNNLDASVYSCKEAAKFPGALTILIFDMNSEGFEKAKRGEIYDSDGKRVGFQGFSKINNLCIAYFFDYSDIDGKHNADWQRDIGTAIMKFGR